MCRIGALKSKKYIHPSMALRLMQPQQKGHDNSGFAMVMQDLGGVFEDYKNKPLISYSCTTEGVRIVERFMADKGFSLAFHWSPKHCFDPELDIDLMKHYHFENYDYPESHKTASDEEKNRLLTSTRLELRKILNETNEGFVFSFWEDVLTLKEIGNPRDIGIFFNLWNEDDKFCSKIITVQCRQNTNYRIERYAAHPFFLQGYTALANGENTFYIKNKEFQESLFPGYIGFESDSQCFLYTLHYVHRVLGWPLEYYKHVITPLPFDIIDSREDRDILLSIRESLSNLEINGPNTIIAVLPDGTIINVCDSKKLRPVVIGQTEDTIIISSEVCGINEIYPDRDIELDIYPDERETIIINNDLKVDRCKQ